MNDYYRQLIELQLQVVLELYYRFLSNETMNVQHLLGSCSVIYKMPRISSRCLSLRAATSWNLSYCGSDEVGANAHVGEYKRRSRKVHVYGSCDLG